MRNISARIITSIATIATFFAASSATIQYSNVDDFYAARMSTKSQRIELACPMTVIAMGQVVNGEHVGKYWMFVTDNKCEHSIVIEADKPFNSIFKPGYAVEYLIFTQWDKSVNDVHGGTLYDYPDSSYPSEPIYYEADSTRYKYENREFLYNSVPIKFSDVTVEDNLVDGIDMFKKLDSSEFSFEDGVHYDIYGIFCNDYMTINYDRGYPVCDYRNCLYVTMVEEVKPSSVVAGSIDEAFVADNGSVIFNCDLNVIGFNATRTHVFVADESGDCMTILSDFSTSTLNPGDIIRDFSAQIYTQHGIRYAETGEQELTMYDVAEIPQPMEINIEDHTNYPGQYVSFKSVIERVQSQSVMARSNELPTIKVGGVAVIPDAIDTSVKEGISKAISNYSDEKIFSFKGFLMADETGSPEFWPSEILDATGNTPTTSVSDTFIHETEIDSKVYDLSGRQIDPANASSGVYIISTSGNSTKKLVK